MLILSSNVHKGVMLVQSLHVEVLGTDSQGFHLQEKWESQRGMHCWKNSVSSSHKCLMLLLHVSIGRSIFMHFLVWFHFNATWNFIPLFKFTW